MAKGKEKTEAASVSSDLAVSGTGPAPGAGKLLLVACMKDEGPFILEWIAYHKAIGIEDFLIITNDCSDGTTELLDRLDYLGLVQHLPNPWMLGTKGPAAQTSTDQTETKKHNFRLPAKGPTVQKMAYNYAKLTPAFRRAEWSMFIDADEFLNVKVGDGTIGCLMEEIGDADAMSVNQVVFGSSGHVAYTDELTIERFLSRFNIEIDDQKSYPLMFGIKTIVRNKPDLFRFANHRPVIQKRRRQTVKWLDGSGRPMSEEFLNTQPRDYRTPQGTHDLAQVNHYAVRSLDSYLLQAIRGDSQNMRIGRNATYWDKYDRNDVVDKTILRNAHATRRIMAQLLGDPVVRGLHTSNVELHRARIEVSLLNPLLAVLDRGIRRLLSLKKAAPREEHLNIIRETDQTLDQMIEELATQSKK